MCLAVEGVNFGRGWPWVRPVVGGVGQECGQLTAAQGKLCLGQMLPWQGDGRGQGRTWTGMAMSRGVFGGVGCEGG